MPTPKRPAKRAGLSDVLGDILAGRDATPPTAATPARAAAATAEAATAAPDTARKGRETLYLSDPLRDRMRNAVVYLSGRPHYLNLATFAESAVLREVERLENEHNGGKPFPPRDRGPARGRPIR